MQVNHQLGTNRNARHQLERDLANKDNAINIGNVEYFDLFTAPKSPQKIPSKCFCFDSADI